MIELIAKLDSATKLLDAALDQYLNACVAIQIYCAQAPTVTGVPHVLSHRIVDELIAAFSHESKIKQARSVISQVKNGSTAITPVYALPSEILSHIFLLVMGSTCCVEANSSKSRHMPRYPDFLSHVCSRWRQIAMTLPGLWTHIDLVYYHSSTHKYIDRANHFASRAGTLPLTVHIRAPASLDVYDGIRTLYDFLPMIAARTESLELTTPSAVGQFDSEVLERLFDIFNPTTLLGFCLTDIGNDEPGYIYASNEQDAGTEPEYDCHLLEMPNSLFEQTLIPVKALRLDGLYICWESQAYHGLVELRLGNPRRRECSVSAAQLHNMFMSSPRLAILHFSLDIADADWVGRRIKPVRLDDLEVLNTSNLLLLESDQLETLLSLFTPGQKALTLTIGLHDQATRFNPSTAVTRFLKHANVVNLCLVGLRNPINFDELHSLTPELRVLALNGYGEPISPFPHTRAYENMLWDDSSVLDTVYLQEGCFRNLDDLFLFIKSYPIRALVFWRVNLFGGHLFEADYLMGTDQLFRSNQIRLALSEYCPSIRCVERHLDDPIKSWGRQS